MRAHAKTGQTELTGFNRRNKTGSLNPNAKLDETKARAIKWMIRAGLTNGEIERLLADWKLPPNTVSSIRQGKRWAHVRTGGAGWV